MVGHDHKFIQNYVGKMLRQITPDILHDQPRAGQHYIPIHHRPPTRVRGHASQWSRNTRRAGRNHIRVGGYCVDCGWVRSQCVSLWRLIIFPLGATRSNLRAFPVGATLAPHCVRCSYLAPPSESRHLPNAWFGRCLFETHFQFTCPACALQEERLHRVNCFS